MLKYKAVFKAIFANMRQGQLKVHCPDGDILVFGQDPSGLSVSIQVHNDDLFKKCFWFGDVGFGESYVEGDWDTEDVARLIEWMIINVEDHPTLMADSTPKAPVNWLNLINILTHKFRQNSLSGSRKNIYSHYDLGNDFFKLFLDSSMLYSAAFFEKPQQSLRDAQLAKCDRLCQKLMLKSNDHVLEIGSGWGGMATHMARTYGCRVTTVTISQQQYDYTVNLVKELNLTAYVDVQLCDYRKIEGRFDKIVSIEMIEAVGARYYDVFFKKCQSLLSAKGLFALQMIRCPDHRFQSFKRNVDWIQKHIFPGSLLPSMTAIQNAILKTGSCWLYDFEDITPHYVKTLALWRSAFWENIHEVRALNLDEGFIRKWNYYLAYCEAAFNTFNISVAQTVYAQPNSFYFLPHSQTQATSMTKFSVR